MIKIFNAGQIKAADAYTIEHEPVSSIDLMERASRAFTSWFTTRFTIDYKVGVVCGTGNNGGDGLAIARMLKTSGYDVKVWLVRGGNETPDFTKNLSRLGSAIAVAEIKSSPAKEDFQDRSLIVDAIFGSGLSRPLEGVAAATVASLNEAHCVRVAVDVPSGLLLDQPTMGVALHADYTLTFQFPKLAFLLPANGQYVGEWCIADIRLNKQYIKDTATPYFYLSPKGIKKRLKIRKKFSNKGDFGKALLITGSFGKMGASILSAMAALRTGVGLLTVHVPVAGYSVIQTAVPEAMALVDADEKLFTDAGSLEKFTVVGIGPGLGEADATKAGLEKVLEQNKPMVIDADALNILGKHRELLKKIPAGSILSPHPKEFERLTEKWSDDFDRLEKQKKLAKEINAVIILKGAHTSIAIPDGVIYFNATGNPGMATGGTGDVLTGILTALLAQQYGAEDAAIIGVYLHGLAGDLAAVEKGQNSLIAMDVVDFLPNSFKKILA